MSTIRDRFTIRGMDCEIETTDGERPESRAMLYVSVAGRTITDTSGYCSPIYSAYSGRNGWKLRTTYGAARNSMIRRILREAVEAEIEAHVDWCRQEASLISSEEVAS